MMRVLTICCMVISAAVGVTGCFYHQQVAVQHAAAATPLK
jgi:hypothetical protein